MQKFSNEGDIYKNAPMAKFVQRLQNIGKYNYLALIAYYPVLFFALDPNASNLSFFTLTFFWLPMLFAVPGLVKGNPYTYAWSNFVLMWCFMHGLTAIWTFTGNKLFIVTELVFLTLAFIGNTYFARYRGRELDMALPKIKELKKQEDELYGSDSKSSKNTEA